MSDSTSSPSASGSDHQQPRRPRNRNRNRNRQGQERRNDQNDSRPPRPQGKGGSKISKPHQGKGAGPIRSKRHLKANAKLSFWQKILSFFGLYKADKAPKTDRQREIRRQTREAAAKVARHEEKGIREPLAPKVIDSPKLYVGNLAYEVTDSDLEDLFKGIGSVRRTEVIYNAKTHRSKGYAFVTMGTIGEAQRAIEVLHDQYFMGRKLVINGAKSHQEQTDADATEESASTEAA